MFLRQITALFGLNYNPKKPKSMISRGIERLSMKSKKTEFVTYKKARKYVRSLGLKSFKEWRVWSVSGQRPACIPGDPRSFYLSKGWISWGDFLGTGYVALHRRKYLPFSEARTVVRTFNIKSSVEWREWAKSGKISDNIPANPDKVYKGQGWTSWGDFLGTGYVALQQRKYLAYEKARDFVKTLGLKSSSNWYSWASSGNRPANIPYDPYKTYKNCGWVSWGDFLGTDFVANSRRKFLPYNEARAYARTLGFKSSTQWIKWIKEGEKPANVPVNPRTVYFEKGWTCWEDFLGLDTCD